MGGYRSGRHRTINVGTVDSHRRVDVRQLRRAGLFVAGAVTRASLEWRVQLARPIGSAQIVADMTDRKRPFVTIVSDEQPFAIKQRLNLVTLPMPFGGERFYFVCPVLGIRCEVLPSVGGHFASRQALRLNYQSNCDDQFSRLRNARSKLMAELGNHENPPIRRVRNREQKQMRLFRLNLSFVALLENWLGKMALHQHPSS